MAMRQLKLKSTESEQHLRLGGVRRKKMGDHKARVNRELRFVRFKAFFLNLFFIVYACFLAVNLGKSFMDWSSPSWSGWVGLFIASWVVTSAYSFSRQSLGYLILLYSNRLLKQNVGQVGSVVVRQITKYFSILLLMATLAYGFIVTETSIQALFSSDGLIGAKRIMTAMMNPEMSIIETVLDAMIQTIFIALIATVFALPVAFLFGFLCARNLMRGHWWSMSVYNVLRVIFNFARSVEPTSSR